MQYFNFDYLIKRYECDFVSVTTLESYYDETGDWKEGDVAVKQLRGAIINFKESRIFNSGNTLSTQDKRLFTTSPINQTDFDSKAVRDCKVIYQNNVYTVVDETENAQFTGVYAYTLKYVSAFKKYAAENDITAWFDRLEQRLDGVLVELKPPVESKPKDSDSLGKRLDGKLYWDV